MISNVCSRRRRLPTSTLGNTLAVTGYNAATGVVSYSYTLMDNERCGWDGHQQPVENFAVVVTDQDEQTASDTLVATIIDDVPTAVADTDSVVAGTPGPATGNVLTGGTDALDSNTTDGVADVLGADGAVVVGGCRGHHQCRPRQRGDAGYADPGQLRQADAGRGRQLQLHADAGTAGGANDVFTYTVKDGDGDLSHTTLTISIGNSTPTITNLTPAAGAVDATVNEKGLLRPGAASRRVRARSPTADADQQQ